jgi:hypothetical protein
MGGFLAGIVKAVPFRSLERTDKSASAITQKLNESENEVFENAHFRFDHIFHLITRALKRTVGLASLKTGKQG